MDMADTVLMAITNRDITTTDQSPLLPGSLTGLENDRAQLPSMQHARVDTVSIASCDVSTASPPPSPV